MVRARLEVGADRFGDLLGGAVRDHGVDQAVASRRRRCPLACSRT